MTNFFGSGLPKHTFENLCVEDPKIKLGDRAYKLFFISQNCAKLLDERQKAFLRMVTENKASDKFTGRVLELLDDAKRNTQWRKQYMEWEREKTYEREAGKEAGREEKAAETAANLIKMGVGTMDQIAQATGVPMKKLQEIAANISVEA
ncbi:MAG: hypothetical protein K5917_03320 [Clostridiales bacterium]|nr:hypothetical protein [Clostridiales bacterium]